MKQELQMIRELLIHEDIEFVKQGLMLWESLGYDFWQFIDSYIDMSLGNWDQLINREVKFDETFVRQIVRKFLNASRVSKFYRHYEYVNAMAKLHLYDISPEFRRHFQSLYIPILRMEYMNDFHSKAEDVGCFYRIGSFGNNSNFGIRDRPYSYRY